MIKIKAAIFIYQSRLNTDWWFRVGKSPKDYFVSGRGDGSRDSAIKEARDVIDLPVLPKVVEIENPFNYCH